MNLRFSENHLKAHLNKHKLRKDFAIAQFKTENDAKVQDAQQNAVGAKLERNSVGGGMGSKIINTPGAKEKAEKGNLYQPRTKSSWKQQWAEINGVRKFYRSQWELNYAYYLEWLRVNGQIKSWLHEPETFWFDGVKRGTCSYLPDFKVEGNDGSISFHEVKGWMDDRSKTKLKRMAKYHPDVVLVLIDAKAYKQIERKLSKVVPGWINKN